MASETSIVYKTLLTKEEYDRIYQKVKKNPGNLQVNYYFDTKRFTLKASDAELRAKKKDNITLICERKKGYNKIRIDEVISQEEFDQLLNNGIIVNEKIKNELEDIVKDQTIVEYMSLSTYRISAYYKKGRISLDKCEYVDTTDYELEYEVVNRELGKCEFIELIKIFNINYKKSKAKLLRAYDALRKKI